MIWAIAGLLLVMLIANVVVCLPDKFRKKGKK